VNAIRSSTGFACIFLVYISDTKGRLETFSARQAEVGEGISKSSK